MFLFSFIAHSIVTYWLEIDICENLAFLWLFFFCLGGTYLNKNLLSSNSLFWGVNVGHWGVNGSLEQWYYIHNLVPYFAPVSSNLVKHHFCHLILLFCTEWWEMRGVTWHIIIKIVRLVNLVPFSVILLAPVATNSGKSLLSISASKDWMSKYQVLHGVVWNKGIRFWIMVPF